MQEEADVQGGNKLGATGTRRWGGGVCVCVWMESKGREEADKNGGVRRSPLGEFTPARPIQTKCVCVCFKLFPQL